MSIFAAMTVTIKVIGHAEMDLLTTADTFWPKQLEKLLSKSALDDHVSFAFCSTKPLSECRVSRAVLYSVNQHFDMFLQVTQRCFCLFQRNRRIAMKLIDCSFCGFESVVVIHRI